MPIHNCKKIFFSVVLLGAIYASSAAYDNRFIPLLQRPYITAEGRPSHAAFDVFMVTGNKAFGALEDEIGIPELYGAYNEQDIAESFVAIGKPNPLPAEFQGLSLPWNVQGKIQGQGIDFRYQQQILRWLSVGMSGLFMRANSRQDFFFKQTDTARLTPAEQEEIATLRREMQAELGLEGPLSDQVGMGDLDIYIRFGDDWDYALKFRHILAAVRLGVIVPSGVRRNINNPSSIPFGGNGFWGMYTAFDSEFEIKEDWKFGLFLRFSKRFAETRIHRMAVGKEPYIYGPVVGCACVNPGFIFVFSPSILFENLREGLGARLIYTMCYHWRDCWSDARTDKTIPVSFTNAQDFSGWASDYFTLNVLYDFGKVKTVREFEPIVSFAWDIPASLIVGRSFSKTQRISLGLEFNF